MGKERCGTCRFFQDAELAASGWCHHPLRKTSSDLLLMVRRNELACRDAWAHSLWEPGVFAGGEAEAAEPPRPQRPATEPEIAALIKTDFAARAGAEDIVLNEARLVAEERHWPPPGAERPAAEPGPRYDLDTRSAIRKARELYRERARLQAQSASADGGGEAAAAPPNPPNAPRELRQNAGVRPEERSERAMEPDGEPAPVPHLDAAPEDADADEWVVEDADLATPRPDVGVDMEANDAVERTTDAVPAAEVDEPDWGDDEGWWDEPLPANTPAAGGPRVVHSPWSIATAALRRVGATPPANVADEWPVAAEPVEAIAAPIAAEALTDPDETTAGGWDWAAAAEAPAPGRLEGGRNGEEPEPELSTPAVPTASEADDGPAGVVGLVLNGVTRQCRTCRSFRPAEGGDRGWCANRWAFSHHRMVEPEDAEPCRSSIGSWWLPADDLLFAGVDVSAHGQPTPHLDRWLPGYRERLAERKPS